MSTIEKKKAVSVAPFAIEADTPRNQDLMFQNLGNIRLRGAVSATVEVFDKTGEEEDDEEHTTLPTGAKLIEGVRAPIPGMQLYVNPAELEWKVADPLFKKEGAMERIQKAMSRAFGVTAVNQKLRGMKPKSGSLGRDEMKTLCKEILCFVEAGEAKVVKGMAPSIEDVDALPGKYLLNWSNMNQWRQPRYAEDYDRWIDRVGQLEGET